MRRTLRWWRPAGVLGAVALACVGCGADGAARLDVRLRTAPGQDVRDGVDAFLFAVADADGRTLLLRRAAAGQGPLSLDGIPWGTRLVFSLTGFAGEEAMVMGRTCPVDVLEGQSLPPVSMFVGRTAAFAAAQEPPVSPPISPLAFVRADGAVVIAGGARLDGTASRAAASFNPRTGVWADEAPLAFARKYAAIAPLPGGSALVVGGLDADGATVVTTPEVYRPADGFVPLPPDPRAARIFARAAALPDGRVLVTGGSQGEGEALDEAFAYERGAFASAGFMTTSRRRHTLSVVGTAALWAGFVIGGEAGPAGPLLDSIELFNPHASSSPFSREAARLVTARADHAAVVLATGEVLLLGGRGVAGALASAELFDPTSRSVLPAGTMAQARVDPVATLLPDGRVLVMGGRSAGGEPLASVEVWDGKTRAFTEAAPMLTARAGHVAVPLCDGTALVVGGGAGAELYVSRSVSP